MVGWFTGQSPATSSESSTASNSSTAERFQAGLLAQRRRADSQVFWLVVAQWVAMLSASIAMANHWERARLDSLSFAVICVGVLSILPLVMVQRWPGSQWSRWTVVVSQGVMSSLLWYVLGGRPETHLHLFAWLVVLALYRDVSVLLGTVAVSLAGHALVFGSSTLPTLAAGDTTLEFTYLVCLAWLFAETAFMVAFVLLDRQTLAIHVEQAQSLEALQSEFQAKVEDLTRKTVEERDFLKGEVASLTERRASIEAARFEAMRELLSLRREIASLGTEILKLASRPADSSLTKEWRARWQSLRQQAQQLLRLVDLPSTGRPEESPGAPSQLKPTVVEQPPSAGQPLVAGQAPAARQAPLAGQMSAKAVKRALLMMRNPLQQAKAVAAMETVGYMVDVVPNGPRTYYSVMLNDYSLIMVDIDLPGEEGFDTVEALRLLPPDRVGESNCLFALTTALTPERVLRCTELKVDGMFVKPLNAEALQQTLSGSSASPQTSSGRPEDGRRASGSGESKRAERDDSRTDRTGFVLPRTV